MELADRHVLITGGSRGIGAAMADQFARRGARVSVAARSADALAAVANRVGGHAFTVDLTDPGEVDGLMASVAEKAGPVDVLVNNAGLETSQGFHTADPDLLRTVIRLNLEAPVVLTRHAIDHMLEQNRGRLVFISSLAGTGGFPGLAAYCATKAGLTNFAATLDLELKDTNIATTVIAPGPVDTQMWDNLLDANELEPMVNRLNRLQLIPKVSPIKIAQLTVDAVANDKSYVGLPKRLGANHVLRNLPTKITDLVLRGVPLGPQLNR